MEHRNTELELDFPSIQAITIVTHTHASAYTLTSYSHYRAAYVCGITRSTHHLRLSLDFSLSWAAFVFIPLRSSIFGAQ